MMDANLAQKQSKMFSEAEIEIYKVFKEQSWRKLRKYYF